MSGKVFIASMNMRGKWAERPVDACVLNVTSMQKKDNMERRDFSPMSEVKDGYKGFFCFENYWQSGKVYEGFDRVKFKKWWMKQTKGKRRYPGSKGKKVLHAEFNEEELDYVQSRKKVYVPEYFELMNATESLKKWKNIVEKGKSVVVYDFDGPRENYEPVCKEVTLEFLREKINDTRYPFGHGYIVAAALCGINCSEYLV